MHRGGQRGEPVELGDRRIDFGGEQSGSIGAGTGMNRS
jgi:hypothetical protein